MLQRHNSTVQRQREYLWKVDSVCRHLLLHYSCCKIWVSMNIRLFKIAVNITCKLRIMYYLFHTVLTVSCSVAWKTRERISVVQLCCAPEHPADADSIHAPGMVLQVSVPGMAFNTFNFNPLFISSFYGVQNFEATLSFWKMFWHSF